MALEQPIQYSAEPCFLKSEYLEREVRLDVYLPLIPPSGELTLLLINDGQDLPKMPFLQILNSPVNNLVQMMCVGIYCGPLRKMEYGTASIANWKGEGGKAGLYTDFIFKELLPYLRQNYAVSYKGKAFAGFSLGGLSALDIVWNYPFEFSKVGVFSGSHWWRSLGYGDGYDDDKHRIMHQQIRKGMHYPWLKFFFECGTLDEKEDRNKNGIIDSIDDTMDLIGELKKLGYTDDQVYYLEIEGGKHNVATWAQAFPAFLQWAFTAD